MTFWLIPANTKFYDVFAAFSCEETYWPMNAKIMAQDIIYIYLAAPYKQVGFRCEVLETGYDLATVLDHVNPFIKGDVDQGPNSKPFMKLSSTIVVPIEAEATLSLSKLRDNGLSGMLMGARKLENNPALFEYIGKAFE
ncbi:hypothetical protein, partial [Roseobacter sp.]|uniref:hypothetical protein n=1 Tax=Roseobacter sp. TaxID=1907202 RepID=UPI003299A33E